MACPMPRKGGAAKTMTFSTVWRFLPYDVFYRLKQNGLLNGDNFDVATPPNGKGVYVNIDKNTKVVSKERKGNHAAYAKKQANVRVVC